MALCLHRGQGGVTGTRVESRTEGVKFISLDTGFSGI